MVICSPPFKFNGSYDISREIRDNPTIFTLSDLNNILSNEMVKGAREYWSSQLKGNLPALDIPSDLSRPAVFIPKGMRIHKIIGNKSFTNLKIIARENNTTIFKIF